MHTRVPDFYHDSAGPTRRFVHQPQEIDKVYFDLMFTENLWDLMIRETNNYHDQMVASEPNKHKGPWQPVTKEEMEAFIGILILMGIVKLPRLKMYWREDVLLHQKSISSIMPRTRFLQLMRYFHLADH